MLRDNEVLACVHDLRVLVSSLQAHASELASEAEAQSDSAVLRNQLGLLADILRIWSLTASDTAHAPERDLDLRAVVFLAKVRNPSTMLAEAPLPVRAPVRPQALLELLDVVFFWAGGQGGRCAVELHSGPPSIVVYALDAPAEVTEREAREVEHTIRSMAASAGVEPWLERPARRARLRWPEHEALDG